MSYRKGEGGIFTDPISDYASQGHFTMRPPGKIGMQINQTGIFWANREPL